MNPKVDKYLAKPGPWQEAMTKLRELLLESGMTEELKWGKPCYTVGESNVIILLGFKNYCALLFCKGALLKDPEKILVRPTESTQAARQLRLKGLDTVLEKEKILQAYIREAVEVEQAGLKVEYKKNPEPVPDELLSKFKENPALKTAFESLTPGRQRGYILFISGAKQSKTRVSRIEKYEQKILAGKGMDD
jgi:uncharacterized protein YdeI (YjbR/CyaY-like superfamily)